MLMKNKLLEVEELVFEAINLGFDEDQEILAYVQDHIHPKAIVTLPLVSEIAAEIAATQAYYNQTFFPTMR